MKKCAFSFNLVMVVLLSAILSACSSSTSTANDNSGSTASDESTDDGNLLTGQFVDSPVAGLAYITSSGLSGVTDASGQFKYVLGDVIDFSLGSLQLGRFEAGSKITPFDLVGFQLPSANVQLSDLTSEIVKYETGNVNAFSAGVNMLIFLQSLDQNNNADDGIVLGQAIALFISTAAAVLNFNQSSDDFLSEFLVLFTALVANDLLSRSANDEPVSSNQALAHFLESAF